MKKEKQLLLDEMKEHMESSGSFVVANYAKLRANEAHEFRKKVAKAGGSFKVVRKRVFIKAAEALDVKLDLNALAGHIGVVFAKEDPVAVTKTIIEHAEASGAALDLLLAQVDGKLVQKSEVKKLADLPTKDVMRAQLLGLFEAPMVEVLSVMDALLCAPIHCLENRVQQSAN